MYGPDLSGCHTFFGKDLADAIYMVEDAATMWLWDAENKSEDIPAASAVSEVQAPQFVDLIVADTDEYRKKYGNDGQEVYYRSTKVEPR